MLMMFQVTFLLMRQAIKIVHPVDWTCINGYDKRQDIGRSRTHDPVVCSLVSYS